ncbi:MAG: hypothetical protein R3B59_09090 [Dehalococcoidia bacterium]
MSTRASSGGLYVSLMYRGTTKVTPSSGHLGELRGADSWFQRAEVLALDSYRFVQYLSPSILTGRLYALYGQPFGLKLSSW